MKYMMEGKQMKKRIAFMVMLISIASSQMASADTGVVTANELRVRQNFSLSSTIEGHLSKDTKIEILAKAGEFYKIAYKGKIGYVHSSYIKIANSITPSRGAVSVKSTSIEKQGEITASSLNVRSGAGVNYAVTGSITKGGKVTTSGEVNGFYKINYSGKTSYISASYVKIIGEKAVNTNSTSSTDSKNVADTTEIKSTGVGTVMVSSFLNVRKTASLGDNIMGRVYPTNKVNIYAAEGSFYKIKYDNKWGYVHQSYVKVVNTKAVNTKIIKPEFVDSGRQYDTDVTGDKVVSYSKKFLGMPYLWGGTTPAKFDAMGKYVSGGFDCSGFVQYSYKNFGISLPRTTMDQVNVGATVNINNLQSGDLLYFKTNDADPSQVSHVGIYIGDNTFIHSLKPGDVIKTSKLVGYYIDNFVTAKRIIS
jgi:cell wall-associated NlpC family hydrolase